MTTSRQRSLASARTTIGPGQLYRLLDLHQAAFYLGLSYWTLRGMLHRGDLPFIRASRRILVDRQDLDAWIEANKTQEAHLRAWDPPKCWKGINEEKVKIEEGGTLR